MGSTELQHGKRCQYKDTNGEPCQGRAKGRWVPPQGGNEGKWVFEFCEKHGGYNPGESVGPPRGMKQQGEVLERVMERLEIMDSGAAGSVLAARSQLEERSWQ